MGNWLIYGLGGLITLGLWDFTKKYIISKGVSKELYLVTFSFLVVVLFLGNWFFQGSGELSKKILFDGTLVGLSSFPGTLGIIIALKYLNVGFTFVAIRLVSSFLVLLIGIYVIGDKLTTLNFLGFFIGAYAIFLLSGFSKNDLGKLNSRGLFGVIISIVGITFSHTYYKFIADGTNFHDLMLIQSTVSFLCFGIYAIIRRKYKDFNTREFKLCLFPAFIVANLTLLYFLYFLPNMYLLGSLSLSYKMLSYSLIVPIILSVIFLGEKLNKKKIFALVLTVISIALFI